MGVVDIPPEISYHLRGRNKFSLVRRERTKNTSVINLILFDSWSKKKKKFNPQKDGLIHFFIEQDPFYVEMIEKQMEKHMLFCP